MTNEREEIKKLSQEIIKSLESYTTDGIEKYKSILLENEQLLLFEDFLHQLQKKLKKCTCQTSWNTKVLIISCLDCQKDKNSCICVDCYLKGNHEGHKIILHHGNYGCCDCGDPFSWSESGFCCDHTGPESNPELTQLDPSLRIKLISISNSALYYCNKFANTNRKYFNNIIQFLIRLVSLGDATRRCVSIAFCDSFDLLSLYINSTNFGSSEYRNLHNLISSISSDNVFRTHFTALVFNKFPTLLQISRRLSLNYTNPSEQPILSIENLFDITFFATTRSVLLQLIRDSKIDWFTILNASLHLIMNYDDNQMTRTFLNNSFRFSAFLRLFLLLKSAMQVFGGKDPKIIETVEKFVETIEINEFTYPFVRIFGNKADDTNRYQESVFDISFDIRHILSRVINYKIFTKKPLITLKNFFDSTKFKSIDKKVNDYKIYFHSVLSKNVQICQSFSTHLYALFCLDLKEKTLFDYISEVTNDAELFIKRWAVLPLRWTATSILSDFNFYVRNTYDTITTLISYKFRKNIKYFFVPTFTLIQSLLRATRNVDDFLLMIISTFDLTVIEDKDDLNLDGNEKRLVLFCIFHFISCLIFDTLCSSRNFYMMHRFEIFSALMKDNMTMEKINSIWYKDILYDEKFLDDLKSFTSRETTKNGTTFHLTDDSEWHPLLPHLRLSNIIPLIQKFIDKNPDSLINFPEIPNGSEYLLFSPTLWALMYCILDNDSCKEYRIIHQLIFNVLIAISNNSESFYKGKCSVNEVDDSILHVDEFENLVEELRQLNFDQFMKKKIDFNMNHEDDGKSMIDLISSLGNVGLTVLKRMNISGIEKILSKENLQIKEELQKKKNKERANKIKSQMMNNFIQKQKTFQSSVSQNNEIEEKASKIECGICHIENESDCFVYPALIYKSSLSSYLKWRFRNATLIDSNDNHLNDFTNIPDKFQSFNSVHICLHPIHSHCIQAEKYSCPADRCKRNSALPIIDGFFDLNPISNESVLSEINKFVSKSYHNDIKFAIFSLASEIEVLEMRHRSNPNCLDNKVVAASLRNIYLCIWHSLHSNSQKLLEIEEIERRKREIVKKVENKSWNEYKNRVLNKVTDLSEINEDESIESNVNRICQILLPIQDQQTSENKESEMIHLSPLMKYILFSMDLDFDQSLDMKDFVNGKLLPLNIQQNDIKLNINESDSIFNDFDVINDLSTDYNKLQFLRCAAIFDHFSRNKKIIQNKTSKSDEFIDWDEILSSSFLNEYYKIHQENNGNNIDEEELILPMFSFCDVPKNFLDFVRPPFSLPILSNESDDEIAICLLTGQVVSMSFTSLYKNKIRDFVDEKFDGSYSIFLALNGSKSSEVFVVNRQSHQQISLKSFYANKFDDIDVGIKKGFLLFANESKREEIIDNFLSGSWTNSLDSY